eukprot:g3942.t1
MLRVVAKSLPRLSSCRSVSSLAADSSSIPVDYRQEIADDVADFNYLIEKVAPMISEYRLRNAEPDDTTVVEFQTPEELIQELCDLRNGMPTKGQSLDEIVDAVGKALRYSVRTAHPRYFDKLCHGSDSVGQIAELVTAVLNTNVHTFAVAPVFSTLEVECIRAMAHEIGYKRETADGILCPGGTFANVTALMVARHACFPHVKENGFGPKDKAVCFTSTQAHYSIKRAAMMAGIGMNGCIPVAATREGSMDAAALDDAISRERENGRTPFFVSATAGTTVLGGYDPFHEIRAVVDKHNETLRKPDGSGGIWFHVDGAWGGSACFSKKHRHLVDGVETSDSMSWNFQKGLGVPVYCAAVVTNNKQGMLESANASAAQYLFHDHPAAAYDLGDKSLQCGRRADSLKLWLSWKRHGSEGFRARVDHAIENSQYLAEQIKLRPSFALVTEPSYNNVCWWYIPAHLRKQAEENGMESIYGELEDVSLAMRLEYQRRGSLLCDIAPLPDHGLPKFFRIILNMPTVTKSDMRFVLDELEVIGEEMFGK